MTTVAELLQFCPSAPLNEAWATIQPNHLVLDSRAVQPGDVFVALKGSQRDGREFIDSAIANGASLVFAESDSIQGSPIKDALIKGDLIKEEWRGDVAVLFLPHLTQKLSHMAAQFYGCPANSLHGFAVTGTNGKTTCSHLYANLRQRLGDRVGVVGTLGYGVYGEPLNETGYTTPDAIYLQKILSELNDHSVDFLSVEASSHSLDQGRLNAVPISSALYTNLSRDHLDYHGDMESYAQSKWQLFDRGELKIAVINWDDDYGRQWLSRLSSQVSTYSYSIENAQADVFASEIRYHDQGVNARLTTPWGNTEIQSPLMGAFNLSNLLGVLTVLLAEGVALEKLAPELAAIKPIAGRMQSLPKKAGQPHVVIDFAHTPDGLQHALTALRQHCQGQLWCIFGCGGDRDTGKRPQMAAVSESIADSIVVTNDNPRSEQPEDIAEQIMQGFKKPENVKVLLDRGQAIEWAINQAGENDCLLVAGKGHESYQLIGNQRLDHCDYQICSKVLAQRGQTL